MANEVDPVHLSALHLSDASGAVRLFGAGFGDGTLRGYALGPTPTLDAVVWQGGDGAPVNVGSVGPTVAPQVAGAWALDEASDGGLLLTGRFAHALVRFGPPTGALAVEVAITQGERVEGGLQQVGLVPAEGLLRPGPVAVAGNLAFVSGSDGLSRFEVGSSGLGFLGMDPRLGGADALAVLGDPRDELGALLVMARCRAQRNGDPCLSATDPAELVVVRVVAGQTPEPSALIAYDPNATDGREAMLGNGSLAVRTSSLADHVLAHFEGSATVVAVALDRTSGAATVDGSRRVLAPYWDPAALPGLTDAAVATSTSAPLVGGQLAVWDDRVFAAATSGGFIAHFDFGCLAQPLETAGCTEVLCLDATGGCAGPSAASATPHYPYAVTATTGATYVGVDVLDAAGAVTTRIGTMEVDVTAGTATLLSLDDA